jgi:hypothetical protein
LNRGLELSPLERGQAKLTKESVDHKAEELDYVAALELTLVQRNHQACGSKVPEDGRLDAGELCRATTGKKEVVDVVNQAVAARAPRFGKLAHYHRENVAGGCKTEWELCENIVPALPLEAQVLPM